MNRNARLSGAVVVLGAQLCHALARTNHRVNGRIVAEGETNIVHRFLRIDSHGIGNEKNLRLPVGVWSNVNQFAWGRNPNGVELCLDKLAGCLPDRPTVLDVASIGFDLTSDVVVAVIDLVPGGVTDRNKDRLGVQSELGSEEKDALVYRFGCGRDHACGETSNGKISSEAAQ